MEELLEQGFAWDRQGKRHGFHMRRLYVEDAEAVLLLQQRVLEELEDKEVFLGRPEDILRECLGSQGAAVGSFVGERLVGFRMLYYPGQFNQGEFLGMPQEKWNDIVHLEVEAVDREFRGNSLQRRMGRPLLDCDPDVRGKKYMTSVVAPQNYPSVKDKLYMGLLVERLILLGGDHWRYIFCRDRRQNLVFRPETICSVPCSQWERQRDLLEEGYSGFYLYQGLNGMELLLGKLENIG